MDGVNLTNVNGNTSFDGVTNDNQSVIQSSEEVYASGLSGSCCCYSQEKTLLQLQTQFLTVIP